MIFDLEASILAKLAGALPVGTSLVGTFGNVDLTDDAAAPIVCQLQFERAIGSRTIPGSTVSMDVEWSFCVYCHKSRATSGDLTAAEGMLPAAINALVRWQYATGRYVLMTDGPQTVFDGQVLRLGVSFFTTAHFAGN